MAERYDSQDERETDELIRESQRETADWSAHQSSREPAEFAVDRQTVSFGPGVEDFNDYSDRPAESASAPESREIPKAVVVKTPPHADMSPQEFISNLTGEGREMLKILLTTEDIRNGKVLTELEREHNKKGFVILAFYMIERKNLDQHDTARLAMALKTKEVLPILELGGSAEDVNKFVDALTDEQKEALKDYLTMQNKRDMGEVYELNKKHGKVVFELSYAVDQLQKRFGCSAQAMNNALQVRLKGGDVSADHLKPSVMVQDRQRDIKTIISTQKRREDMVKRRASFGGALFGKKPKKES